MQYQMNYIKFKNVHIIAFIFFSFLILLKSYFIFIKPVSSQYFTYSANIFIFYNLKSFLEIPQSFYDWNHPGTPIYYFYGFLNNILNITKIENFQKYIFISHFFCILFYIFSIYFFLKYFLNKINTKLILIFIFFSFSFTYSIQTLDVIDPTYFLFPLALVLCVYSDKIFFEKKSKTKHIIKFSIFLALACSIKLTFLPFLLVILICLTFKNLSLFFKFFFLFSSSFIIFNFPILGRIPKIFFHIIFLREDTSVEFSSLLIKLKEILDFIFFHNFFLFLFLLVILIIFTKKIFLIKLKDIKKVQFLYAFLISATFAYTLILTSYEIKGYKNSWGIADLFRNCYIYSIFFIPLVRIFHLKKIEINFLLIITFFSMILNVYDYIDTRNTKVENIKKKNYIFTKILKEKKINLTDNLTALYSRSGYPFKDETIFYLANSIFAGEKFNNEILNQYKYLRLFRLNDILLQNENIPITHNKIRKRYDDFDKKLESNFSKNIYLILSHKSFQKTNTSLGSNNRSKNLFIKNTDDKIKYIIYNENDGILKDDNKFFVRNYIRNHKDINVKQITNIKIDNDTWVIYELLQ
jgi:hypothetical protein